MKKKRAHITAYGSKIGARNHHRHKEDRQTMILRQLLRREGRTKRRNEIKRKTYEKRRQARAKKTTRKKKNKAQMMNQRA